jgi:hypothetical protein
MSTGAPGEHPGPQSAAVDSAYLKNQGIPIIGQMVHAHKLKDLGGEHILALSRRDGLSMASPNRARIERIELLAAYHTRDHKGRWKQQWSIRDSTDCPGLDSEGDFFAGDVQFTDLNRDGIMEVTVPYHLFCGGGVDPRTVKVILRDGSTKLAIRGESELRFPGQPPIGGKHRHDKALLDPANSAFKRHLNAVWRKVSVERRP